MGVPASRSIGTFKPLDFSIMQRNKHDEMFYGWEPVSPTRRHNDFFKRGADKLRMQTTSYVLSQTAQLGESAPKSRSAAVLRFPLAPEELGQSHRKRLTRQPARFVLRPIHISMQPMVKVLGQITMAFRNCDVWNRLTVTN